MGTIALIGIGVFLGWLMFRPKNDNRRMSSADLPQKQQLTQQQQTKQQMATGQRPQVASALQHRENNSGNHTLRNVAGGMVAGAVNSSANVLRAALQILKTAQDTKLVSAFFLVSTILKSSFFIL